MIKPTGSRVYIAEVKVDQTTAGGIILASDNALRETKFARVEAVGPDVKTIAVGDEIVLDWSKCWPVKVDGTERALIDEENILAVR